MILILRTRLIYLKHDFTSNSKELFSLLENAGSQQAVNKTCLLLYILCKLDVIYYLHSTINIPTGIHL